MQQDLFSAANLASSIAIPPPPVLDVGPWRAWPFPGCSPEDCAKCSLASSKEYLDVIAATIKRNASMKLTDEGVLALIPHDWREILGRYAHGNLPPRLAEDYGIRTEFLDHAPAFGFSWVYHIEEPTHD